MALDKTEKESIIKDFAQAKGDTGSPEIQIALLSNEIGKLKSHLDEHKKDASAKRGLLTKIAKRRRLLRYLLTRSKDRFEEVAKRLDINK